MWGGGGGGGIALKLTAVFHIHNRSHRCLLHTSIENYIKGRTASKPCKWGEVAGGEGLNARQGRAVYTRMHMCLCVCVLTALMLTELFFSFLSR